MKPRLKPIKDQAVVLLGATSGIGLETALLMAEKGAKVAIVGRSQEGLNDALERLRSHMEVSRMAMARGGNGQTQSGSVGDEGGSFGAQGTSGTMVSEMEEQIVGLEADVTNFDQIKSMADQVIQRFGRIDTWVNVAAVSEWALFEDTTPQEFHRIIEVNLLGQAYGAMVALPYLKQQGGGALIFVASLEGRIPVPYQSAYNASKHGIVGLSETLRQEIRHTGVPISVTTILPASMNTPLFDKARTKIGVEPEPLNPIYDARMVARAIVYAAEHPVPELIVGDSGYMVTFMRRLAPNLTSNFIGATGFRSQQRSNEPKSAQAPDNLYEHISGYSEMQGSYPGNRFALLTWFSTHPRARMALYGGLLTGLGILAGWRIVTLRNQRRGWRYQLPRRAIKAYKQATRESVKALRKASKVSEKALSNASDVVGGLPVVSNLPVFRKRSAFDQLGDLAIGAWAALTSLSLPFINRRKPVMQRLADRMPNVSAPWKRSQTISKKVVKQTNKSMNKLDKQVEKAQKRAEKALDRVENRSREAMKAVARRTPSKSDIQDMVRKGQVVERRRTFVEKLPFGERKETVVEKMPYRK